MELEPDLSFCGLSLWVHQRQFPDSADYWDANWLMISAKMEAPGACVRCDGPMLMTEDIQRFRDGLSVMHATLVGEAVLKGLEPNISVALTMQSKGHLEAVIHMTPDHLNQLHRFTVEADQSYLPNLIASCDTVLRAFPVINIAMR